MGTLPFELQDLIIGHMQGDKDALASCGLVSRSWLYLSRPHLFGSVTLHDHNCRDFLQLKASPCCTFIPSIRTLTISRAENKKRIWHVWRTFMMLMPELAGFPSLTCFRVFFVTWMDLLATSITSFITVCRDITELDIQHAAFQTPHQVITLLARLPRLEKVTVHSKIVAEYSYQTWRLPQLPGPPIPPRNLQIIRLHLKFSNSLGNSCWPSIFNWILEGQSTVRMLGLGQLWGENLPAIGTRLGTLAPVLCDLDLALMSNVSSHLVETHLTPYLVLLTRVTRLTVRIGPCIGHLRSMSVHWYASLALLAALPRSPAALETLTVFFAVEWTYLERLDWARLYAAVRMHTRLRLLQFRVGGHPFKSAERAMEVIRKHVAPDIAARVSVEELSDS